MALVGGVEELVAPPEAIRCSPEVSVLRVGEKAGEVTQCGRARDKREQRVAGIEQDGDVASEFVPRTS